MYKKGILKEVSICSGSAIFDVAAFDSKGEILYGIEVFHKHRTPVFGSRNRYSWFELKSNELFFTDYREDALCNGKDCSRPDPSFDHVETQLSKISLVEFIKRDDGYGITLC